MKSRRISFSALTVVLLGTQGSIPAGAQTRNMSYGDSLAFQRVDQSVGPHSRLRVLDEMRAFEARGSDVTLQGIHRVAARGEGGGAGSDLVSWSDIQKVQVRGNEAGKGAVIGATTIGLMVGTLAVVAATADFGLGPSRDPDVGQIVMVVGGFTMGGAVVGGAIGALIPSWKTIHTWAGF